MYISIATLCGFIVGTVLGIFFATTRIIIRLRKNRIERKEELIPLAEGDVVLYVDPSSSAKERNLITSVLVVIPAYGNAVIRARSTTMLVSQKHLQVLRVDKTFPLLVPERPKAQAVVPDTKSHIRFETFSENEPLPCGAKGICSPGNQATFSSIPLSWLKYRVGLNKKGKLCTV